MRVQGRTRAQIARDLDVTERTITTDLARIAELRIIEFTSHIDVNGRLHSRDVYTAVQAAAWRAVETILNPPNDAAAGSAAVPHSQDRTRLPENRFRNLAPLLRIVNESQRAIDTLPPLSGLAQTGPAAADIVKLIASAIPPPPGAPPAR